MTKLGMKAAAGITAGALSVAAFVGVASAGMGGDAVRSGGAVAAREASGAVDTAGTAAWYARGTAELATAETAHVADRTAGPAVAGLTGSSDEDDERGDHPVRDTLEQVSRTAEAGERLVADSGRTAGATVTEQAGAAAGTVDAAEEALRR